MTDTAMENYAKQIREQADCFRGRRTTRKQTETLLSSVAKLYQTIAACYMTEEMENNNANKEVS